MKFTTVIKKLPFLYLMPAVLFSLGCQASETGGEHSHGGYDHAVKEMSAHMDEKSESAHYEGGHEHATETDFGKPGQLSEVTRTIDVSMGDNMRFVPSSFSIKQGEIIRFVVKNTGAIAHEMVLGTADELREHAEMMKKMPGMRHTDPSSVRVEPGQTGEIIWNFDLAGNFEFACLVSGHSEAGMKGALSVEASPDQ